MFWGCCWGVLKCVCWGVCGVDVDRFFIQRTTGRKTHEFCFTLNLCIILDLLYLVYCLEFSSCLYIFVYVRQALGLGRVRAPVSIFPLFSYNQEFKRLPRGSWRRNVQVKRWVWPSWTRTNVF